MNATRCVRFAITVSCLAATFWGCHAARSILPGSPRQIRVAVIGGMVETGFWQALAERFEQSTGNRYKIEVVAVGPKHIIADAFRKGQADLITMHASDTIINLVADGYAVDPQPWLKNDLVIVGPPDDPAGIRGMRSAAEALAKIASAARPWSYMQVSAQEVMRDVLNAGNVNMPSEHMTFLFTDRAGRCSRWPGRNMPTRSWAGFPFSTASCPTRDLF